MNEPLWMTDKEVEIYREKGILKENKKLAIRYFPGAPLNKIGWNRYKYRKIGGKVKVDVVNGKQYVEVNALYINEAFIRFVSPIAERRNTKGQFYVYRIAHYPDGKEEIINWNVGAQLSGRLVNMFHLMGLTEDNTHEFVFHVSKYGTRAPGIWSANLYFHDAGMPAIEEGQKLPFRFPAGSRPSKFWLTPRAQDGVQFIKDVLLPLEVDVPDEEKYVHWFVDYLGFDETQAHEAIKCRGEVRLP